MNIALFGNIDKDNLEEYYSAEIMFDHVLINVGLNFESQSIDQSSVESVSSFVGNIESMISTSFAAISADYDLGEESETARFYLQHHIDELTKENLIAIFGKTDIDKECFMEKLSLKSVNLYPEDEESFAIFDIQLPEEFTNYLMAVTFDDKGELSYISMDS